MFFRLKKGVGSHSQTNKDGDVVTYQAKDGIVIDSDKDLCKMFPDKFEAVDLPGSGLLSLESTDEEKAAVQAAAEKGAKDLQPPDDDDDDDEDETRPVPKGSKEVTKKYKIAKKQDMKVFYKKGKGYFVTEGDDEDNALNMDKLKKVDVEDFIEEYIEEDE